MSVELDVLIKIREQTHVKIVDLVDEFQLSRRSIQRYLTKLDGYCFIIYTRGYLTRTGPVDGKASYIG